MAARFVKDLIQAGTFHPPGRERVTFTDADIEQMMVNGRAMLSAGVNVPLAWDHEPTAKPRTPSEVAAHRAKNTLGNVADFRFSPDGRLEVLAAVDDDADGKQVLKTKFVSPGLQQNFKDGNGTVYPGWSVIHAAVTPRPVNADQRPFQQLSHGATGKIVCLSLADLEPVNMAATDTEEQDTDLTNDEGIDKPEPDEQSIETSTFKRAVEALAKVGLAISDDVSEADFFDHIITAVETKMAADGLSPTDDSTEPPDDAHPPEGHGAGGMGMVGMSLEQATAKLIKHERDGINRRIDRLLKSRRIPVPVHAKLKSAANAVELSFGDDGEIVPNKVLGKLEAYEELPEGHAFAGQTKSIKGGAKGDANLSHASVVTMPADSRGKPESPEEVNEAVNAFFAT